MALKNSSKRGYQSLFKGITNPNFNNSIIALSCVLSFFIFTLIWLVFGEIRNKFIKVILSETTITVKKFGGLFFTTQYAITEIEGWRYSVLSSSGGSYEYLYLYQNGKKIAKISEFYHQNYQEAKIYLKKNIKYLGFEPFGYIAELKEIFKK